jgi:segregation and condensation protein B
MLIEEQQNQHQPELESIAGDDNTESTNSLDSAESTGVSVEITYTEISESSPSSELETTEGEAPFAGFASDPGIADLAAESSESGESGEEGEESPPEPIVYRDLNPTELQAAVEATFFMHHRPISISRLRELINPEISEEDYRTAVSNLMASYFDDSRGVELVEVANGFQFRTKSEHKDIVRRMYQIAPMKLTNAMLEVLAITAYNQPITREVVDKIRGVDSSHLLRVLLDKKMLRIVGKSDEIGRPMIYGTTKEFLELFGLRDLGSLPSLREIEDMLPKNEVGAEISEEEALAKDMEGIVDASKPLEFNDLEMEDWEANEGEKSEQNKAQLSLHADSNGSAKSNSSPEAGSESGDLDLPPEVARRLPLGPEGHA